MMADLKKCQYCGKEFTPCATKINGAVTWRRRFCSPECFQSAMRNMDEQVINEPHPIDALPMSAESYPVKRNKKAKK